MQAALLLAVAGCAAVPPPSPAPPPAPAKNVFLLLPDAQGRVGAVTVTNAGGVRTLDTAGQATRVRDAQSAPTVPQVLGQAEIEGLFGAALITEPVPPMHFNLYFEADSTALTAASRDDIPRILDAIRERSSADTSVTGHTDTLGDPKRNFELGLRRAMAIGSLLAAAGVDPGLLDIGSHGETNLLVPTPDGAAEPRNRRVEVTVR